MRVPHVDTEQLLQLLDQAFDTHDQPPLIATDGDGTLWEGDIGETLFDALLAADGVRPAAEPMLREHAAACGLSLPSAMSPTDVARALLAAFEEGTYREDSAFAMMAWAFAGWEHAEVESFTAGVLEAFGFERRVRPSMRAMLDWAEKNATPVWLVSASPQCGVHAAASHLGIPLDQTLSMEPNRDSVRLLPGLSAPPTYGAGKMERLRAAAGKTRLLAAFGDSNYDGALLREARVPVAVHPAPSLVAELDRFSGIVQLGEANH